MKIIIEQKPANTPVYLTPDEVLLFIEFKRNYKIVAYILGFMESLHLEDMRETNVVLDIDKTGIISHAAITKHFRS
jgi:Holliday junction resolvase